MDICAGIVLYNPDIAKLAMNIEALANQVHQIFAFDNASENRDEIEMLLSMYPNIHYYRNNVNSGIAYALNRIFDYAEENHFEWCLTMDQDSVCCDGMISEFIKLFDDKEIALICPFILNNGKYSLEQYHTLNLPKIQLLTKPIECITSATLNRVSAIKSVGGFNEDMFIDYVDTELNYRILQSGYKIIRVNSAYMVQSMGEGKKIDWISRLYRNTGIDLFRRMQVVTVYNDTRLYYQSRNSRYIRKKFKRHEIATSFIYMLFLHLYFTAFYPKNRSRIKMWKSIIKGFIDTKLLF